MREIIVKWSGACKRCGHDLDPGQEAMYEKSMGIFCPGHEPIEVEDIRHFRLVKAEAKAEGLGARADRMDQEASRKMDAFNEARKDFAWLTQPGYIPGREKITRRYDAGCALSLEADQIRAKAERIRLETV